MARELLNDSRAMLVNLTGSWANLKRFDWKDLT
jgi:hypothetical protein